MCILYAAGVCRGLTTPSCTLLGVLYIYRLGVSNLFVLYNHYLELRSSLLPFGTARASSAVLSLNRDLELRSSSLTFGRTRASSVLLSLNRDLLASVDVEALGCRLAVEAATVEGVPL